MLTGRNPGGSGVPFRQLSKSGLAPNVDSAPYLQHFFNKNSVDRSAGDKLAVISDLKGDLVYDFANIGANAKLYVGDGLDNNSIQIHSGGTQTASFSGTPYSAGASDNILYVVAGYLDDQSESNLIFRIGNSGKADGGIRIALDDCADGAPTTPATISIGHDIADVGAVVQVSQGNIRLPRATAEITQDRGNGLFYPVILVCMMDRANDQAMFKTWIVNDMPQSPIETYAAQSAGNYTGANHQTPGDITGLGVISPTIGLPSDSTGASFSMQGYFYGMGVWKFSDNYVPPNWYEAAVSMGHAWIDGRYDFYPF